MKSTRLEVMEALILNKFSSSQIQEAQWMRGIKKVAAEMSLTVLAYNIKRVTNILGVRKMLEAVG